MTGADLLHCGGDQVRCLPLRREGCHRSAAIASDVPGDVRARPTGRGLTGRRRPPPCLMPMFAFLRIRQRTRIDTVLPVMTDRIVIAEKSSQAKDVRAAVGSHHGTVLAAEGHPRGAAHGGTGLTRHRLQPPGSAHRPGDANLPLSQ